MYDDSGLIIIILYYYYLAISIKEVIAVLTVNLSLWICSVRFRDFAQCTIPCIVCEKEGENKEVSLRESSVLASNSCAYNALRYTAEKLN